MRAPEVIDAGELVLARWHPDHAEAHCEAVEASRPELSRFLDWAATPATVDEQRAVIARAVARHDAGESFAYSVFERRTGELVGCCGLHPQDGRPMEIGYWVRTDRTGRGHATALARALAATAFDDLGVEVVEIRCDAANHASARVAARLGFRLVEGLASEPHASASTGWYLVWAAHGATGDRQPASEVRVSPLGGGPVGLDDLVAAMGQREWFADRHERQASGACLLVVATVDGRVVGDVALWLDTHHEPEIEAALGGVPGIQHLEVAEAERRRGIGARLVLAAEQEAAARGHERVLLGVETGNDGARRLYERLGYREWDGGQVPTSWPALVDGRPTTYHTTMHVMVKRLAPRAPALRRPSPAPVRG